MQKEKRIEQLLTHGVEEVITRKELKEKLESGKKLVIKLGADPSRPDLHLGHAVVLRKLKAFQELGHKVVFIIGDYTGLIGDPSGKSKTRPQLTETEIKENAKSYFKQAGKILNVKKTEIRYNSEWFKKFSAVDFIKLASKFTVARILERDDFEKRLRRGVEIALHELLYPPVQAYDSIAIKADVEIGGTDQRFNLLAGRELQKKMGKTPQNVMTMPLLIGLDGTNKMSKSLDNYIGLFDAPADMYGKVMSIPDNLINHYFILCTDLDKQEIDEIDNDIKKGANPRDVKMRLARAIVTIYHSISDAKKAEEAFINQFQKKEIPDDIPEHKLKSEKNIVDILIETGFASSKSEARRLIEQGGVKLDGEKMIDVDKDIKPKKDGSVLQKGKRGFIKLM